MSVIAAGHKVTGTVSAAEDLVVQGRVEGRIQSEATVVIAEQAIVEGEIVARHVLVKGIVIGDVSGVDGIEIAPSGQVLGDLKTRRLALRAGGRVLGQVQTAIEVAGFSFAGKAGGASSWQRGAARPTRASSFTEEVVETFSTPEVPAGRGDDRGTSRASAIESKRSKKEPSREAH